MKDERQERGLKRIGMSQETQINEMESILENNRRKRQEKEINNGGKP